MNEPRQVTPRKVAVLVGSLRKDSVNRKVANALIELAPAGLALGNVEFADLPLYNQDIEDSPPAAWTRFREQIRASDAVLFVTPEYNRSIPAGLKNAIDVGSRPFGQSAWNARPGAVVSASPGNMGGFGANHHLRQSLVFLNIAAMPQPEAYIGGADKLFDAQGKLINEGTRRFLQSFMQAFGEWIETLQKSEARH
jgi:chromate reductase